MNIHCLCELGVCFPWHRLVMLVALPAELLVHVIVQLAAAGDFARVAKVCAACNTVIGRAVYDGSAMRASLR